jgi:glycosyltransferase involved in cell wall biosynthesis
MDHVPCRQARLETAHKPPSATLATLRRWAHRLHALLRGASPADRPRVLVMTITSYPDDGRPFREVRGLVDAGYQVTVICGLARRRPRREVMDGVSVYRFQNPFLDQAARMQVSAASKRDRRLRPKGLLGYVLGWGVSTVAALFHSVRVLRRPGFDVVHVHNPPDTLAPLAAVYKLFGKRIVYDHHDLAPDMYYARSKGGGRPFVHRILLALEKRSCRAADHVITTNNSYRIVEIERGGISSDRITIVRNGPDLAQLQAVEPDPRVREWATWIIGYVGVMGVQDGVDHLLRAVHHLIADLGKADCLCILVGAGNAWDDLQRLSAELDLGGHVRFTGWLSRADAMRTIASVDVGVEPAPSNPYNDRSTMVKVMEYMALGKPVVAYDLPENRFTAQAAALYASPNSEIELARAIATLLDDPERGASMGAFGRMRVEQELSWEHSVQQLLKAYREIAPLPG